MFWDGRVTESTIWLPADLSYLWTPRVLCCRTSETNLKLYLEVLRLCQEYHSSNENSHITVCAPKVPTGLAELPQLIYNLSAIYWATGLVVSLPREFSTEKTLEYVRVSLEKFQVTCHVQGVERVTMIFLDTGDVSKNMMQAISSLCSERGAGCFFISVLDTERQKFNRSGIVELIQHFERVCMKAISDRLNADTTEQDLFQAQDESSNSRLLETSVTTTKRRQIIEAKLRKQRADCLLLLRQPVEALAQYNHTLELYKSINDLACQAVIHECIAAILVLCSAEVNRTLSESTSSPHTTKSPVSPSPLSNIPAGQGLLVDSVVKEALAFKKGSVSILQQIFGEKTVLSTLVANVFQESHENNMQALLTPNSQVRVGKDAILMTAAAAVHLQEAGNLYCKTKNGEGAALLSGVAACSLVVDMDDKHAALSALHKVAEDAQKCNSAVAVYALLCCAALCTTLKAPKTLGYFLQQVTIKLNSPSLPSSHQNVITDRNKLNEIWTLTYRASLFSAPWFGLSLISYPELQLRDLPNLELQPLEWKPVAEALMNVKQNLNRALTDISLSRICSAVSSIALSSESLRFLQSHAKKLESYELHLDEGIAWPTLQTTILDRLRRASDRMGWTFAVVWFAYTSLLLLNNALDVRIQSGTLKLINAKAAQMLGHTRLRQIGVDRNDFENNDEENIFQNSQVPLLHGNKKQQYGMMTWLVPPSLTVIGSASNKGHFFQRLEQRGQKCYTSLKRKVEGLNFAQLQNHRNEAFYRFTVIGGLCNGLAPYIPLLVGLEPSVAASSDRNNKQQPFSRTIKKVFRCNNSSKVARKQRSSGGLFLYQPWLGRSSSLMPTNDPRSTSDVCWTVDELYSVAVCIKNPLAGELVLDHTRIVTDGAEAESHPITVLIPPSGNQEVIFEVNIVPKEPGIINIVGLTYKFCRVDTCQLLLKDTEDVANYFLGDSSLVPSITDILQSSAISSIVVTPPMPLLSIKVLFENYNSSEIGKELLNGQEFQLAIQMHNITETPINELTIIIEYPNNSNNEKTLLSSDEIEGLNIFIDGSIKSSLNWQCGICHTSHLAHEEETMNDEDISCKASSSIIPPNTKSILKVKQVASSAMLQLANLNMRFSYSTGDSVDYLRETIIAVPISVIPGPKLIRRKIIPITSLPDRTELLSGMRESGCYSFDFGPIMKYQSSTNCDESFLCLELNNPTDMLFQCELLDTHTCVQHNFLLKSTTEHVRWLVPIERCELWEGDMDSAFELRWSTVEQLVNPMRGRLFFADEERMTCHNNSNIIRSFSSNRKHNLITAASLSEEALNMNKVPIGIEVEVTGPLISRQEEGGSNSRCYKSFTDSMFTVEVTTTMPALIALFPFVSSNSWDKPVVNACDVLPWIGTLESRDSVIKHECTFLPIHSDTFNVAVVVFLNKMRRIWWYHEPVTVKVQLLSPEDNNDCSKSLTSPSVNYAACRSLNSAGS